MKRSWIGFILLLVLLAGSILTTGIMTAMHEPIEADLLQAAECAILGDWDNAGRFFRQAEKTWDKGTHIRACFADHNPVEEIDGEFVLLKVYCAYGDTVSFAGGCAQLARQVAAVGEAHELVWWNFF